MQASTHANSTQVLLSLPRELRDDIYAYLVLPEHVFTSTTTPDTRSLHRTNRKVDTYIDTRIYLPVRPPANILETCKQLRDEYLDFMCRLLNSLHPTIIAEEESSEGPKSSRLAALVNRAVEEGIERARDDGSLRLTLEIMRVIRGNMGAYMPAHELPSPRFMSLLPLMSRLKKIKLIVWADWSWWKGPEKRMNRPSFAWPEARSKRTTSDRTDELAPGKDDQPVTASEPPPKPNVLSVAVNSILPHLPALEELRIDVLMHVSDYWNWDLPDNRAEGIQDWLDDPVILPNGKPPMKVYKRLLACEPSTSAAIFYHKLEEWDTKSQNGSCEAIRISAGMGEVPEEWDEALAEPPFTNVYSRAL